MSPKTVYILRHGQTHWNLARRMQGRMDSALTELGRIQADIHGRTLARLGGVDAIVASPLGRTRETAALANVHLQVPVRFEPALMERDCGEWSGLTLDEIAAAYPAEWQARQHDPYFHRPPGGESLEDMEVRVRGFLDSLERGAERTLALVTHGVMSRVILKRLLALDPVEAGRVRHPNDLFYRLRMAEAGKSEGDHFVDGQGPRRGLLHQNESETIPGNGGFDRHTMGGKP